MMLSLPDVSSTDLGRGFDFFEANFLGTPFDSASLPPANSTAVPPAETVSFFAQLVEDTSSLSQLIDVSAQAEFGFGMFKGRMSASYNSALETSSYSLFVVGNVDVQLEKVGYSTNDLAKLRLSSEITSWFNNADALAQFRGSYGDLFVTGLVKGGLLSFIVEIKTNSVHDKSVATASIGGSGASWSASADFKRSIDAASSGRQVVAHVFQSGATWDFKDLDADALFQVAVDYPNQVVSNPVIRAVELTPYDSVQNWPSATITKYTPLLALGDVVTGCQEWHRQYKEILSDVTFVMDNQEAYQNVQSASLQTLKDTVQHQDDLLISGVTALVEDPLGHLEFKREGVCADPVTYRNQVPAWRQDLPGSAADIVALYPTAPDGDYTIWLGRDVHKKVTLFCRMGGDPKEYLRLSAPNWSTLTASNINTQTSWTMIRLDPDGLNVDLTDISGSTSTGGAPVPYGAAMAYNGTQTTARIDLTGTLFSFDPGMTFGVIMLGTADNGGFDVDTSKAAQYRAFGVFNSGWGPKFGVQNALRLAYTGPEKQ